jgi:hypothetical protein
MLRDRDLFERPGKRDVTLIESETLEAYKRESGQKLSAAEAPAESAHAGGALE